MRLIRFDGGNLLISPKYINTIKRIRNKSTVRNCSEACFSGAGSAITVTNHYHSVVSSSCFLEEELSIEWRVYVYVCAGAGV